MFKLSIAVSALLLLGCDGKSAAPKGDGAKAPAKPSAAKEDKPAKAEAKGNPHAKAEAKNPHAGLKGGPHSGMAKPKPKGPPRDITPSGEVTEETIKELVLGIPKEWEKQPAGGMRVAQWTIPGPGGDGECVVFRFPGGAGGVEANIKRWKGMFKPPEGKTIDDISKTTDFKAGDLKVTLVDVTGHYVAAVRPGEDAKHDESDYRMLAAIIEGQGDPFFLKTTGPQKTLDLWADPYTKALKEAKVKK